MSKKKAFAITTGVILVGLVFGLGAFYHSPAMPGAGEDGYPINEYCEDGGFIDFTSATSGLVSWDLGCDCGPGTCYSTILCGSGGCDGVLRPNPFCSGDYELAVIQTNEAGALNIREAGCN